MKPEELILDVVQVAKKNGLGHVASSLSCVHILQAVYRVYREGVDRVVLSKGHGCYALYSILAHRGQIPMEWWRALGTRASPLNGCCERHPDMGLEASTGSLGHGLPMAVGMAYALSRTDPRARVFCIVGDGELQEGSCWEALQFAVRHALDRLLVIVDCNHLQALCPTSEVVRGDLEAKLAAWGLRVDSVPGHNPKALDKALAPKVEMARPMALVASTVKGFGVPYMEGRAEWHYRALPRANGKS